MADCIPPAGRAEEQAIYTAQVLSNENFLKQGKMAKMKGRYTFVDCMARYNPHWFGWRFLLRWLGKQLGGRRPGAHREVEEGMTKLMAATVPGAASTGTEAGPGVAVRAAEDMKRELKA